MRIALVSCCLERGNLSFPLGALCIEAAISQDPVLSSNPTRHFSYLNDSDDPASAAREVLAWHPDVVGLSVYLWNRRWFDSFASCLAGSDSGQRLPADSAHPLIFAGGPEVTADFSSFDLDVYSFICAGEGETADIAALRQLQEGREPSGQGIISKANPHFSYAFAENLSEVPSVLLSGVADRFLKKEKTALWEMTRGCPFGCAFCFESRGLRSVRRFEFERLEKELDILIRHKVRDVFVLDPTFNTDKGFADKVLRLLMEKAPEWMHFSFEIRAELLDKRLASLFSRLFCSLQIGLQSINPAALKAVNRSFNQEVFKEKTDLLNKYGIVYGLDLIYGLPFDTPESFARSLDFAISCKPSNIDIFRLAVLPGTQLCEKSEEFHLKFDRSAPYLLESSPTFNRRGLEACLRLKEACDFIYTKGEACMWFHSLCEASGLAPSETLGRFREFCPDFTAGMGCDADEMYEIQDDFARWLLGKGNPMLPALLSYMELHQAISFIHCTGESPVVSLSYDPDALKDLDDSDIRDFARLRKPFRSKRDYQLFQNDDGSIAFVEVS